MQVTSSRAAATAYGLRVAFPPLAALFTYTTLSDLVPQVRHSLADPVLISMDHALFGTDVSRWLNDQIGSPAVTLVLALCYWCCAWPQFLYSVYLYRQSTRRYQEFQLGLTIIYVVGYSFYILVPAVGPHLYQDSLFPDPLAVDGTFGGGLIASIEAAQGTARDVFPSLHTALTILLLIFSWNWSRRLFWCFLPVGLLLLLATQYLRVHYFVDLLAGLFLAAFAASLARVIVRYWFPPGIDRTYPHPLVQSHADVAR
ncbi:hypothetical protein JCM4814A_02600 [Streptomyces phaeofaciens JCM 4814]|uniref:Inositolphosphotransferase Aur1/Ipt1 domain-containing protein n=1 Tax=Streptomyces phaeofaciens TaxID=68254 RepID=A0A918M0F0_9ACTN|nr:hypothetical protein GCM10010226_83640 [Streptomyces phaeofaciens]